MTSPEQCDIRLLSPPLGQDNVGGSTTRWSQTFKPSVRPGRRCRGSNLRQKGPCRSQGGLTSHCATDTPSEINWLCEWIPTWKVNVRTRTIAELFVILRSTGSQNGPWHRKSRGLISKSGCVVSYHACTKILWHGLKPTQVHNKVFSGFQALRQARAPMSGSNPRQKGPCRSQGGLASDCATDTPSEQHIKLQSCNSHPEINWRCEWIPTWKVNVGTRTIAELFVILRSTGGQNGPWHRKSRGLITKCGCVVSNHA
ncbi:hypothetical protein PoB_004888700 [Plakobranchus ocellatus]|uniref:Uncharacterized protein n=1 Tax=Plakobranchus ocellatus TaxID=259542 RepID=A0AAV4BTQ8_9GAST|nr:hypothetical protein PoB_004888700 [Plakobranchus ocellatus]